MTHCQTYQEASLKLDESEFCRGYKGLYAKD